MQVWERNLEVLLRRDSALAARVQNCDELNEVTVELAKNGEPIAKRKGICLHSSYNPTREASDWLVQACFDSTSHLTVLGFGFGYHVKSLAEAGFSGVFIEPDLALFRLALQQLDLTRVLEQFQPLVGVPLETMRRSQRDLLAGEIAIHPASLRTNPEYFQKLADFSRSLALVRKGGLKVLVVNPIYGGSLPAAQHCTSALRQLGHDVRVFSAEAFAAGMKFSEQFTLANHRTSFLNGMMSFLSQGAELMAREFKPDLVLALAQAPLQPATLRIFSQLGIPTAFWFVEDYRVLPYWREVAASYSYFFPIQKGDFPAELARIGVSRHSYLPTAAAPEIHAPALLTASEREEFGSQLSFTGAGYYNRQQFFKGLTDYPFKIWGSDWPMLLPLSPFIQRGATRIDTETCVKIFNASAVNLNLHSSTHHEGVDPAGDFVNPRTFEIASCSSFQLVDRRSLMSDLFAEDELETFSCMADLRGKIDHFLTDPEARITIAEKGRRRVLAEHSYLSRMEEMLTLMTCEFPVISDKQLHRLERQEALQTEMAIQDNLLKIIAKTRPGGAVRLTDIYQSIEEIPGELSRAEKIFLMLKNIEVQQGVSS